jgi:hypothetical protein
VAAPIDGSAQLGKTVDTGSNDQNLWMALGL